MSPSASVYSGSAAMFRLTTLRFFAARTPVCRCGYRRSANAEPSTTVTYALCPAGDSSSPSAGDGVWAYRAAATRTMPPHPPVVIAMDSSAAKIVQMISTSLTMEMSAGARSPDRKVYSASTTNAAVSGHPPGTPITSSTALSPMSCRAMYGMVAPIPTSATATASVREPNRARTNSATVTNPCRWVTDQSRPSSG